MSAFERFIASASTMAARVDALLLALLLLSAVTVAGVVLTIAFFCVRYRRGSAASREPVPTRSAALETLWIGAPLALFFAIFLWAAWLYAALWSPPRDALQIAIVAKQWMWKAQHPGGQREINELHVPLGQPVRLAMTSQDVIHSFYVPAFRVKQDVLPGRYTSLWFEPTREGEFALLCAEFCGTGHSRMTGRIVVLAPEDYQAWLDARPATASMAAQGAELFRAYGCSGCHGAARTVQAPHLAGLWGREEALEGGGRVTVDADYVRESILYPSRKVAAGYAPIMPSYAGQLDEEQILRLIAYVRALGQEQEEAP
ncbi:MAG TPA: cytochrome c oxidase subunit II [Pelomicrobium sp.]|nr:cytochrome c oxidase subunit II [Pelomicrobium sp.]